MDKSPINIFEVRKVTRQFSFKISAADVYKDNLYLGDEKGNIYSYSFRINDTNIISKNVNEQSKSITKNKIDKIICYQPISMLIIQSDEKLFVMDTELNRFQQIAIKVYDFAINQSFGKEGGLQSIVVITRKKEGMVFFFNPVIAKFQDTKTKFQILELPTSVGYTENYILLANKKQYESLNIPKSFAVKKGPLQPKNHPILKVTNNSQVMFFNQDIAIFMDPEFNIKQKDNIFVNRAIISINLAGNYCFILCESLLQIYTTYDIKKFTLVQEISLNNIKGITNDKPFIYNRDEISFLYEIPYEIQVNSLVDRCRVDDAVALIIQKIGPDSQDKIQQTKINAVWPLIRKMHFEKANNIIREINFDLREIILLFPEFVSLQIQSLKIRAQKTISTMIIEYINEKNPKGKEDDGELKKRSKLFLKEILQFKREYYEAQSGSKVKIHFKTSKHSPVKQKLPPATPTQLLQIIDFCLIKWFFDMNMLQPLEQFFQSNPIIHCTRLFQEFDAIVKKNPKMMDYPTLKPRLYMGFNRIEQSFQGWKQVAQSSSKQDLIKTACEQAIRLLAQFQNRYQIYDHLKWILKKNPKVGMSFFKLVDLNFLSPDQIIHRFQEDNKNHLQLFLEIIIFEKKTERQSYHTKLMILYIEDLFNLHPKENKDQSKQGQFQEKIQRMRKLMKSPQAKYSSDAVLKKIDKCQWLLQDEIYLYSRQHRHEQALKKYLSKQMTSEAEKYCRINQEQCLTIYFKMLLTMYKSYKTSNNDSSLLLQKDIIVFLKKYASNPELDPVVVLELLPEQWMLNDSDKMGGIYQFMESAIIHTLHEKRTTYTSKHLSEMDLLNVQYNLIQAKRAYLRFNYKKKCRICDMLIADKFFVVYPNAFVCHQACAKKQQNTICPVTKQDFQKTYRY